MSSHIPLDPLINHVRTVDILRYLTQRNWVPKPYPGSGVRLLEGPPDDSGNPIVQLIPDSDTMPGFRLRVQELLHALSVIEQRPADQILREIVTQATGTETHTSQNDLWYTFDRTVLPIVFDEIEARQPPSRRAWDADGLRRVLNNVDNPNSPATAYNGVAWPTEYDLHTLLITAARVTIVLASFFQSDEFLAALAKRILSMWRTNCDDFSTRQLERLVECANSAAEQELAEVFETNVSVDAPGEDQPASDVAESDMVSPQSNDDPNP